jgi:cell shape-determining protein MreD
MNKTAARAPKVLTIDQKKRNERIRAVIRRIIYVILLIISTNIMWTRGSVMPLLMIPLTVSVAVFEPAVISALFSCVSGILLDMVTGSLFGFHGILLLWAGLVTSLLFTLYLRRHFLNVFLLNSAFCAVICLLRYLFYTSIWGYDPQGLIFSAIYIPIFFLSCVFIVPFFYLIKFLVRVLGKINDVKIEEKSDDIVRE